MSSYDILVIVLSVLLALILLMGIVIAVYLFKLIKNVKEISDKARDLANNASSITSTLKKAAAPTVAAKFIIEQISHAAKKHGNSNKKEK